MDNELSLRDHARSAVREEVMRRAWLLFAEQGFEATTIDRIAEAAGMSRRTFFRYFSGKDELVLDRLLASSDGLAEALRSRPAGESAWTALRGAFDELVLAQEAHAELARPLQLMLRDETAVRAIQEEWRRRSLEVLAPLVAERLPVRGTRRGRDPRPLAVAGAALMCLQAAQQAWAEQPGSRLGLLLDEAMSAVASPQL